LGKSGRRGIRTPKGVRQRIYSPPRLSNSGVRPNSTFHFFQVYKNMMHLFKKQEFCQKKKYFLTIVDNEKMYENDLIWNKMAKV
jgi:hypothetical protein